MIVRAGGAAGPRCSVHVHMAAASTGYALAARGTDTRRLRALPGACLNHEYRALHRDVAGAFQGYGAEQNPASYSQLRRTKTFREAAARPAFLADANSLILRDHHQNRTQRFEGRRRHGWSNREADFAPILQPIIILTTILTQRFNASFAAIAIDPSSSEHRLSLEEADRIESHSRRQRHCRGQPSRPR